MTSPGLTLLAAPLLLALAACDGPAADDPEADEVPVIDAVEVVEIGSIDDPDYAFAFPSVLAMTEDGRIVSGHRQGPEVRVFGPAGEALGTLGQPGEGPGEYQGVGTISIEGDSVWVYDGRAYRFIAYDLDSGDALRTVSIPVGESQFDDRMVMPAMRMGPNRYLGDPVAYSHLIASGELTHRYPLIMDADGTQLDTLPPIPYGRNTWAIEYGDGGMYTSQPFADGPLYEIRPDASTVLLDRTVPDDGSYRPMTLIHRTAEGDTVWTRDIEFEIQPIDPSIVDSIMEMRIPDRPPFADRRREMLEAGRRSLYVPDHRPGATMMFVDDDGRSWIRPQYDADRPSAWWVVGPDGEMLARVRIPNDVTLRAGRGGRVWGFRAGEFDVPYIVGLDVDFP